ncbi:MAG: histidinol-phosphatase HisJ family protein [Lachnospiraceae bacterium]
MISADYHCHTRFSSDSDASVEGQIQAAIQKGFSHLCITDHEDIDYDPTVEENFLIDMPDYIQTLTKLQQTYQDKITLHIGVELGLQPHLKEELPAFAASFPFEYIIGSTHLVDKIDPYYSAFWKNFPSDHAGVQRYYEKTLENIRLYDCFDCYGHIDYIKRYAPDKTQSHDYADYRDIIDEILKELIYKGKGIECNTAGFKYALGQPNPQSDIIKRYLELGGELLTIGSDAHQSEHVGYAFDLLPEFLKACGVRYYTIFDHRKPIFLPL